ncbi:MAG: S8 family serine peptidase [Firmicutes bacterium]|nr:S8 family serine peptidase [Bacillota bacterium]
MKKAIICLLVCVLFGTMIVMPSSPTGVNVRASSMLHDEELIETENRAVDLTQDFAYDSVLVMLDEEATVGFHEYTQRDFPELGNVHVEELTAETTQRVKAQIERNSRRTGGTDEEAEDFRRVLRIDFEDKGRNNVLRKIRLLEEREDVLFAEPDFVMTLDSVILPNDPRLSDNRWAIDMINLPKAWGITTGSPDVTVGVIDSGIQVDNFGTAWHAHPDLVNRINRAASYDFTGAGQQSSPFIDANPRAHGSVAAGIIGAAGNDDFGMAGVGWDIRLASLRVFPVSGANDAERDAVATSRVISAIEHAGRHDIRILNFSGGMHSFSHILEDTIRRFDGLFISTAGNNSENNSRFPGAFNLPNLIGVGAIDSLGNLTFIRGGMGVPSGTSGFGSNIEIFAPGGSDDAGGREEHIWGPYRSNGGFIGHIGTSVAAPFVTGVAALIMSIRPGLAPESIRQAIIQGADQITITLPMGQGTQNVRRLNAYGALRAAEHMKDQTRWSQPGFNATTNQHGTVTGSGQESGRYPFRAFNRNTDDNQWSKQASSGHIQLTLNYYVYVHQIEFFNRVSGSGARTRYAEFTGSNGIRLGSRFRAVDSNRGRSVIDVGGVRTRIIRLNVDGSTAGWLTANRIGASEIRIHATRDINNIQVGTYTMDAVGARLELRGNENSFTFRMHRPDGSSLWFGFDGRGTQTALTGTWAAGRGTFNINTAVIYKATVGQVRIYINGSRLLTGDINTSNPISHITVEVTKSGGLPRNFIIATGLQFAPPPSLTSLFDSYGTLNPDIAASILSSLNPSNTAAVDRDTQFRLFPDVGTGHTLALSRLNWRIVHVNGDRVTLWASQVYRNSIFHSRVHDVVGNPNTDWRVLPYRDSMLRSNLLADWNGIASGLPNIGNHILPHGTTAHGANASDPLWIPSFWPGSGGELDVWNLPQGLMTAEWSGAIAGTWLRDVSTTHPNNVRVVLANNGTTAWIWGDNQRWVRPAIHLSLSSLLAAA